MNKKIFRSTSITLIFNLLFLIFACSCFGQGPGSSGILLLTQPISAKAAGVAEAYCSHSGDVYSLYYNPAGLILLQGSEVSFFFQRGLAKDNFGNFLFGSKLKSIGLALGVLYYDTGKVEMIDTAGNTIIKTGEKDIILIIGGATKMLNIPIGCSLKLISSEVFGKEASTLAMDLGVQHKVRGLNIGASLQNFGGELKYLNEGEKLPQTLRFGLSYIKGFRNFRLTGSLDLPYYMNEEELLLLLGIECVFVDTISLRIGHRFNLTNNESEDESITLGLGIKWKNLSFDYAIGITQDLNYPHKIELKIGF